MIGMRKRAALLFVLSVVLIASFGFISIQDASAAGNTDPVDPADDYTFTIAEQPYEILRPTIISDHDINRVLMVISIPEDDSQYFRGYFDKIDLLAQAITSYWGPEVDIMRLERYRAGDINEYDALVVLNEVGGDNFGLLEDIMSNPDDKEIIWMGIDAGHVAHRLMYDNDDTYFSDSMEARIATINYKNRNFVSQVTNTIVLPELLPEIDAERLNADVNVLATYTDENGENGNWIIDINERYLFMPHSIPSYYETNSYALPFLDVLHNSFGHTDGTRRALLRLEDVNAETYSFNSKLENVYLYLRDENIPFHMAFIAKYVNPITGLELTTEDREKFHNLVQFMVGDGSATLITHGYTHQVYNEVSGVGFEFWDIERNRPLVYDSVELVEENMTRAVDTTAAADLPIPDVWETPHYALSELNDNVLHTRYPVRYEPIYGHGAFPFPVLYNGVIYIPENLGYVFTDTDVEVIKENAHLITAFETPIASFFWHPWRDRSEVIELTNFIIDMDYEFVNMYDLVEVKAGFEGYAAVEAIAEFQRKIEASSLYNLYNVRWLIYATIYLICIPGCFIFARKMYLVHTFYRGLKKFDVSIEELEHTAEILDRDMPQIAILVPARNEGMVIGNTVRRLASLNYPKDKYRVIIIVDERELDDDVERTTKEVVEETEIEVYAKYGVHFVEFLEVPKWYSGEFDSWEKTYKKSTKGRALNYALQTMVSDPKFDGIEMFGVLDADGRLDKDVLKEVAFKRLVDDARILQGPVFQVSNFDSVNWVGVCAGLELAMHHLTELPERMARNEVQFLAGTNYFIEKNLMVEVGGWDQTALVEDAELALRLYIEKGERAQWLSCPELEQSPQNFKVYRRQRERWVRGHLFLIPRIVQAPISFRHKVDFLSIILISQFRFIWDIGLPIFALVTMIFGVYMFLPLALVYTSLALMMVTIFIFDTYGHMYRRIGEYINPDITRRELIFFTLKLLMYLPGFAIVQFVPRVMALYNYLFKGDNTSWYKTERTQEMKVVEV